MGHFVYSAATHRLRCKLHLQSAISHHGLQAVKLNKQVAQNGQDDGYHPYWDDGLLSKAQSKLADAPVFLEQQMGCPVHENQKETRE